MSDTPVRPLARFFAGLARALLSALRLIGEVLADIGRSIAAGLVRLARFAAADHRYVYLGTSVLCLLTWPLYRACIPGGGAAAQRYSLLALLPPALCTALLAVPAAFVLFSLAALAAKLRRGRRYKNDPFFKSAAVVRASRLASYAAFAVFFLYAFDRLILGLVSAVSSAAGLDKNPREFFSSMLYMTVKSLPILGHGISVTVRLALFGTAIGFVLALLLVFLRVQTPDRRDNDAVCFAKTLGSRFASLYTTVVRGTPMMVQVLIIYYAGFRIVKGMGYSVTQANQIWSFFNAGLVTISLNTTAYIAEVLRGSIEALDRGQTEAARSLGMSAWETMRKVVFPQAVKNSIPAIGNEFIINIKDSSVLNIIGVVDLMYATSTIAGTYAKQLEVYCMTALIYLCLTYFLSKLLNLIARRLELPVSRGIPSSN